jgi:hypothetical protein
MVLGLTLLAGVGIYYYFWKESRVEAWRQGENAAHYWKVRDAFLGHLRAGEIDQALALTSRRFQHSVSREQLAELAKRFVALDTQKDSQYLGEGVGQSGPPGGDPSGIEHQYMEFNREFSYKGGKTIRITLQVKREKDSLLLLDAPGFVVDLFDIQESINKQFQQ